MPPLRLLLTLSLLACGCATSAPRAASAAHIPNSAMSLNAPSRPKAPRRALTVDRERAQPLLPTPEPGHGPTPEPAPLPAARSAQFGRDFLGAPPSERQLALELQAYPAGLITTLALRFDMGLSDQTSLRAGFNKADRQDYGEHDDESGGGPGGGIGYRHFLEQRDRGAFYGARLDLWSLGIDWREGGQRGSTDALVLQPTAEVGYSWPQGSGWQLDLNLAFGFEINVRTRGESVGEGPIFLLGLGFSYAF